MDINDYKALIMDTVTDITTKNKKHIISLMEKSGIATKKPGESFKFIGSEIVEPVEIYDKELGEQLRLCFSLKETEAILQYEKYEFIKDYRYSSYFDADDFDAFIDQVCKIPVLDDTLENEYVFDRFVKPVVYHHEEYEFLKFNLHFSAVSQSLNEILIKYPVIVVLHKSSKMVEFRFDKMKRVFRGDNRFFYLNIIKELVKFINLEYHITLTQMDLNYMIGISKNREQYNEIQLLSQYMKMTNGGIAQLEVGNNKEYMLPFIDELKSIMEAHSDELANAPGLKESLDDFIFEKDEMSDYPWIEVLWPMEIKTRNIHVKITFNYEDSDFNLVQHYYSNVLFGMERMNYVAKYISDHRNDTSEENG